MEPKSQVILFQPACQGTSSVIAAGTAVTTTGEKAFIGIPMPFTITGIGLYVTVGGATGGPLVVRLDRRPTPNSNTGRVTASGAAYDGTVPAADLLTVTAANFTAGAVIKKQLSMKCDSGDELIFVVPTSGNLSTAGSCCFFVQGYWAGTAATDTDQVVSST